MTTTQSLSTAMVFATVARLAEDPRMITATTVRANGSRPSQALTWRTNATANTTAQSRTRTFWTNRDMNTTEEREERGGMVRKEEGEDLDH